LRQLERLWTPHNPKVAGSNPAPLSLEIEAYERSGVSFVKAAGGKRGVEMVALGALTCVAPPSERQIKRFVHTLRMTGAWLDEVVLGLTAELADRYPGADPPDVFEMLCGAIGGGLESVDVSDLLRAIELMDVSTVRVEEYLRLALEPSRRMPNGDDGDDRAHG
jgi:hypothetical protein